MGSISSTDYKSHKIMYLRNFIASAISLPVFIHLGDSINLVRSVYLASGMNVPISMLFLVIFFRGSWQSVQIVIVALALTAVLHIFGFPLRNLVQTGYFFATYFLLLGFFRYQSYRFCLGTILSVSLSIGLAQILALVYNPGAIPPGQEAYAQFLPTGLTIYNYFQYFSFLVILCSSLTWLYYSKSLGLILISLSIVSAWHTNNYSAQACAVVSLLAMLPGSLPLLMKCRTVATIGIIFCWLFALSAPFLIGFLAGNSIVPLDVLNGRGGIWLYFIERMSIQQLLFTSAWLDPIYRDPHSQAMYYIFNFGLFGFLPLGVFLGIIFTIPLRPRLFLTFAIAPIFFLSEFVNHPSTAVFLALWLALSNRLEFINTSRFRAESYPRRNMAYQVRVASGL